MISGKKTQYLTESGLSGCDLMEPDALGCPELISLSLWRQCPKIDPSKVEPESKEAAKGTPISLECEKIPLFGSLNVWLVVPFPMPVGERHTTDQ